MATVLDMSKRGHKGSTIGKNDPWKLVRTRDGVGKTIIQAKGKCADCNRYARVDNISGKPNIAIEQTFERKHGFVARGKGEKRSLHCGCVELERAMANQQRKDEIMAEQSMPSLKAQHKLFDLLGRMFHVEGDKKGEFVEGWNDARIAKETGLHVEYVTRVRGEIYGALKVPDEIMELKAELRAMREMLKQLETKVDTMIARHSK